MKKIIYISLVILLMVLVTSCNKETKSKEYILYETYIEKLKNNECTDTKFPFNIEINVELLNADLLMYELTIDEPIKKLKDIEILIIHDQETNDSFPSVGIFEKKYTLSSYTDKKNLITKGINLIGYIDKQNEKVEFKVLIRYKETDSVLEKYYKTTKIS